MQAVILAAGESSRFWPLNTKHKSLLKIMGKPLIWYTIDGLKKAGVKEIIVVQGPDKEVEKELSNYELDVEIKYVIQSEPRGMGDAILRAKDLLEDNFVVLNAERLDGGDYVKALTESQKPRAVIYFTRNRNRNALAFRIAILRETGLRIWLKNRKRQRTVGIR
jgi:NDP-sugar pyrophosphorylase family protein